ncbi:response regulator transcription factor [Virgibacillus sp. AGTR]|uniref:response regulator transcription factor n=1 Tax=Virgibacillus sp. AGTR TaxID=2812055 RepID=UPI001D16B002|nr:response regulator transcription factor [Virgibacillus sp. AGTR]MCC2248765.1 response regulator transcription factor [Virgibacillus sp. AGTR]
MIKVVCINMSEGINQNTHLLLENEPDIEMLEIERNTNNRTIFKKLEDFKPDIALIQLNKFTKSIKSKLKEIRESYSHISLMFMMSDVDVNVIRTAIDKEGRGFLVSTITGEGLVHSIRNVYDSQFVFSEAIAKQMIDIIGPKNIGNKEKLKQKLCSNGIDVSKRDMDVLYLMYKNYSNKEIANTLQLSEKTIRDYVSNAYKKVKNSNRKSVIEFLHYLMADD